MYEFAVRAGLGEALVFNTLHGAVGENGELQAMLASFGVPFVGSGAAATRLCSEKASLATASA